MKNELVIVLDFGGQYNQLVARRVRECNVYCEIYSYKTDLQKIKDMNPKGIILTGGPNSCYEADSPTYTKELFELGIPVLGLCYGAQLMMHVLGGEVKRADVREYGKTEVLIDKASSKVFEGVSASTICWMSHFDYIAQIAPGFEITAHTADCPVAAAENAEKQLYAIQFHPEVLHTVQGKEMLSNFVRNVCGCAGDWKMDEFVENSIKEIRAKVGDGKVLCALSGGVDSSVAAVMLSKAIGNQLFSDVLSPAGGVDRIACIGNVPAPADIVRVENIKPDNRSVVICHTTVRLCGKECPAAFLVEKLQLRKGNALFNNFVPNTYHGGYIIFTVLSDFHNASLNRFKLVAWIFSASFSLRHSPILHMIARLNLNV